MRIHTAIVTEVMSGKVLYEQRSQEKRYPASMTKMMTAYLIFEMLKSNKLSLESSLKISKNAASKEGSSLGLEEGKTIPLRDALCCMLVKSANDAATILGEALAKSEAKAAYLMTQKARSLGMSHTNFTNMSGLHDENLYSTAEDIAKLSRALILDFPEFYKFLGLKKYIYQGKIYENFNSLLGKAGVDGMKTGNTDAAGFNLAISAQQDSKRIVAVVMNMESQQQRDEKLLHLIEIGFKKL